jgi:hypothetical protein
MVSEDLIVNTSVLFAWLAVLATFLCLGIIVAIRHVLVAHILKRLAYLHDLACKRIMKASRGKIKEHSREAGK